MYPNFVCLKIKNVFDGSRVLEICGQEYTAQGDDHFIDKAIQLARYWQPHQVTYARIVHLTHWIRENEKHHLPLMEGQDMLACKIFVDKVIDAKFLDLGGRYRELFLAGMRENERLFFEEEFIDTA